MFVKKSKKVKKNNRSSDCLNECFGTSLFIFQSPVTPSSPRCFLSSDWLSSLLKWQFLLSQDSFNDAIFLFRSRIVAFAIFYRADWQFLANVQFQTFCRAHMGDCFLEPKFYFIWRCLSILYHAGRCDLEEGTGCVKDIMWNEDNQMLLKWYWRWKKIIIKYSSAILKVDLSSIGILEE